MCQLVNKIIRVGIFFISILVCPLLLAKEQVASTSKNALPIRLFVDALKVEKTSEDKTDELYFSVTVYPSGSHPYHFRLPTFPNYWLSNHVDQIKSLKMWEANLEENQSVMVIISLIEHDAPPWDNDDLIGTMKLNIKNDKGSLVHEWVKPNQDDDQAVSQTQDAKSLKHEFKLSGDQSLYSIVIRLEPKETQIKKHKSVT